MRCHPALRLSLLLIPLLLILSSSTCLAGVVYVKWDSPNDGPGNDWDHAYYSVQAGIDAALAGDEVWVAGDSAHPYVERITLKDGVGLYGGFAGTETSRDQRDWNANETILDGNQAGSVVTSPSGATQSTVIDGFTIVNGKAVCGGGIHCDSSSPVIANSTVTGNSALAFGAGIWCVSNASPTVVNNTIAENVTEYGCGGGINCSARSSPTILRNLILANRAAQGGGVYCYSTSASVRSNTVVGNVASMHGGGVLCQSSRDLILSGNLIQANMAQRSGGGIYCADRSSIISNNTITANSSASGGGICCGYASSPAVISSNVIAFNSSGIERGQIGTVPTLRSNCVYGNREYDYSGLTPGTSDISLDPKFADVAYGNVHIQADSPCVDAGDDNDARGDFDIDGQPRILNGAGDIGADESDGTTWSPGPYFVVHVSLQGDDASDGSSWASAKRTIQAGLDTALSTNGEVWVQSGTYNERIALRPYVHVYGGFNGTESDRCQRDWRTNVTILDGQSAGSVVMAHTGYSLSVLDGFTIQNGKAGYGGGIYCRYYSSPTFANNVISGNSVTYDGGGILCWFSSPTITNNTITGNIASWNGAAISCERSSPTITGNIISMNTGYRGGGVYCHESAPLIDGNLIAHNASSGIYCWLDSSPTIANNVISRNRASGWSMSGGGIYCAGSPVIANNTIVGNSASPGGGICCEATWTTTTIWNNIVAGNSSGIYKSLYTSTPTLTSNCVFGNTAYNYQGFPTDPTGTNGNISVDPLFLDPAYGDYHLTRLSPCIDAGEDSAVGPDWLDIDGEPRIQLLHVDIGADEYAPIPVQIDVLPGDSANVIHPQPNRTITVAVLSDLSFDARNVDPLKVTFGPGLAKETHNRGHWEDVNRDGLIDLVLHFRCGDAGIQPGDTSVNLYGRLLNGEIIAGSDTITAIGR